MGYSLIQKFSDFESLFLETIREAESQLGFSLSEILQHGPVEKLKETEITQPALLTVSTAIGRWLKNKGVHAEMALGHSVGEYSALVHAEALSFSEAVGLVRLRGRLMQNAVPKGEAGMAALIGASLQAAEALCESVRSESKRVLEVSLLNAPGQIVVSGERSALELAGVKTREFGIRKIVPLEVSGPFHCSLLTKAGDELGVALKRAKIQCPKIPVVSNLTAKPEETSEEIVQNLIGQVSKAVRWEDSIRYVESLGHSHFLEVGAGSVLTGIVKKILPNASVTAFEDFQV